MPPNSPQPEQGGGVNLQRILSMILPQLLGGVSQNLQSPDKDLELAIKQTSKKGILQSMNRPQGGPPMGGQ